MSATAGAASATRKNIRGTKDYRIYFVNFNLPSVPDFSSLKIQGRSIHVVKPEKAEHVRSKLEKAFKDPSFCGDVGSYAGEILREEHGHPDFAIYLKAKEDKEFLGAAICMQVWHEDYNNSDYERDPSSLYIEVLCGSKKIKGAGSILIECLNAIAIELGRSHLALQATPESLPFYTHIGFSCTASTKKCVKPTEAVSSGGGGKTRRQRRMKIKGKK